MKMSFKYNRDIKDDMKLLRKVLESQDLTKEEWEAEISVMDEDVYKEDPSLYTTYQLKLYSRVGPNKSCDECAVFYKNDGDFIAAANPHRIKRLLDELEKLSNKRSESEN